MFDVKFLLNRKAKKAVQKSIKKLGKDFKKPVRKGLRISAKIFQKEMKVLAPKDTKQLTKSIKVRSGKRSRKLLAVNAVSFLNTKEGYYGAFHELGTKHITAKSFIRKAYANKHKEALKQFTATVTSETNKLLKK